MHSPLFPYAASLLDPPPTRNPSPSKIPYDLFHLCTLALVVSVGVYSIKRFYDFGQ
jgi:hypothetical protein